MPRRFALPTALVLVLTISSLSPAADEDVPEHARPVVAPASL